ncbi:MAG: 2-oxoacid:acceptor oxidoreductase subunit alpha [Candidatus Paceibacterota bacterium]
MKNQEYSLIVGGAAGQGSRRAGLLIAKIFNKLGYYVYIYDDYQSLIRGGHNFSQITVSEKKDPVRKEKIDFLLALDKKTIEKHKAKLKKDGLLFFNSNKIEEKGIGIPADNILKQCEGMPIMANTALLAGLSKGIGIGFDLLQKTLIEDLAKEKDKNLKIAKLAYDQTIFPKNGIKIKKVKNHSGLLMTGNEATAEGMAKAGLNIYFAYPMTPASGILHYLAQNQKKLGLLAVQLENEIAVASEAIGSAFAGQRSAVGTSGGGFALMVETISFSAQAEIPFLAINSQRMGPATGVPTYGAQSDLLFVLHPGHGDFEKFIALPSNAEESFYWSGKLLNLAWKYQTPAILLTDKDVSEGTFSIEKKVFNQVKKEKEILWDKKGEYKRYKIVKNGISPLAYPGETKAIIKANSYEHYEDGISVEEDKKAIEAMQEKRLLKFKAMQKEAETLPAVKIFGNKKSKICLIAWGSTVLAAKGVAEKLGLKLIQPLLASPFPEKQIKKALLGVQKVICVETNSLGQMAWLLKANGIKVDKKILKYNSEIFFAEELERKLKKYI